MRTLVELKERIAETLDEISIIEMLKITPEDLVAAFEDKIYDNFDSLVEEMFEEEEEDNNETSREN